MDLTVLDKDKNKFSLNGVCPHCRRDSVFMIVAGPYTEHTDAFRYVYLHCAAMRCQGCLEFILGLVGETRGKTFEYMEHYPLGKPDDSVDKNVPKNIAADFAEAKRCLWVESYKATVAMCRRSVEASCKHLGATGKDLEKKIDNLASQDKITESLKQMAHAVRVSGNRGLHGKKKAIGQPDESAGEDAALVDDLDTFGEAEAKAMIAFTEQFFYHVYAMPALLEQYKPKPKGEASESS